MPEQTSDSVPAPAGAGGRGEREVSRAGNFLAVLVCALALGLLIWAKLQLVAGVPRTAIANPEQASQQPADLSRR